MDLEERIEELLKNTSEEDMSGDTFAERAELYYQKRPQLLALLRDLYNGYISLLDRCNRMEGKHRRHSSLGLIADHDTHFDQEEDVGPSQIDWDAESSLSYQQPPTIPIQNGFVPCLDEIVADLVVKNVEKDILLHQVDDIEQQSYESSRKMDLLKKLLEVLESERIVLLNENVRLGYKMTELLEQNRGLSSDAIFLKRRAAELARCVLKMREDHRVCMLTRKIEDLQGQIYGLEKRNKEYYQELLKRDQQDKEEESTSSTKNKNGGHHQVAFVGCFQLEKLKLKKGNEVVNYDVNVKIGNAKGLSKWWERVKSMDLLMCGLQHNCSSR